MASKTTRFVRDLFLALLSSMLLVLSLPSFDLGFLAWVGLLPLMVAVLGGNPKHGFLVSLICGIVFFVGIFNWIFAVRGITLLHHTVLGIYLGCFFGFFGLAFNFLSRRRGPVPALFAAPFVWISLEYIRSNLGFLSLPWGLLGHSQHAYPIVIQIASITGAYGISLLIVTVNSALVGILLPLVHRFKATWKPDTPVAERGSTAVIVTAGALMTIVLLYGGLTVSKPLRGSEIKVSVVQGNIEQAKKWDRRHAKSIMETYAELTRQASEGRPDLIVWPETATPRAINRDPRLYHQVAHIARTAGTYLLLGSSQHQKLRREDSKEVKYLNSAFLIPPGVGRAGNQQYDKIRLLPFGEYLPLKGIIPWSYINVPDVGGYAPGNDFTVFELSDVRFGVTICWENIFPDLVRRFVNRGAQFVVNITNEAWFGRTAAPYQFLSMNVFRAVENGVYVVRCANTGISCVIDPYGRIVDRVKDNQGQDVFVRGVLSASVIPLESKTFYTRYGDWLVWLSFACSAAFLLIAFVKK